MLGDVQSRIIEVEWNIRVMCESLKTDHKYKENDRSAALGVHNLLYALK